MVLNGEDKKRIEEEERYRAEIRKKAEEETGSSKKKSSRSGCSGCLLVILICIILVFVFGSRYRLTPQEKALRNSQREKDKCQNDTVSAWLMTKQFIQPKLKSPSTAKFQSAHTRDLAKPIGSCKYRVTAYVDSQNAFGAIIRTHFEAVVSYDGNDTWRLMSFKTK